MTRRRHSHLLVRGLFAAALSLVIIAAAASHAVAHGDRITWRNGGFELLAEATADAHRDALDAPLAAVTRR